VNDHFQRAEALTEALVPTPVLRLAFEAARPQGPRFATSGGRTRRQRLIAVIAAAWSGRARHRKPDYAVLCQRT
jgi:hypothetical protein